MLTVFYIVHILGKLGQITDGKLSLNKYIYLTIGILIVNYKNAGKFIFESRRERCFASKKNITFIA